MTENELRRLVVERARVWLGKKESDGSFLEILDAYNAIPGVSYRMRETDPWCAAFVSAVGAVCGLSAVLLSECSCPRMIVLYRRAGRYTESAEGILPGDLVFYDWDGDRVADHVGLIEETGSDGWQVIEGNKSDAVGRRSLRRGDKAILGFARPDYAAAATEADAPEAPPVKILPIGVAKPAPEGDFALRFHTLQAGAGMGTHSSLREEVRAVQRQLWALGFSLGPCGTDGEFGADTRRAVCAFQRERRLSPDGVVGPLTRAALEGVSA